MVARTFRRPDRRTRPWRQYQRERAELAAPWGGIEHVPREALGILDSAARLAVEIELREAGMFQLETTVTDNARDVQRLHLARRYLLRDLERMRREFEKRAKRPTRTLDDIMSASRNEEAARR